jgi:Fungal specific transcription factor domain
MSFIVSFHTNYPQIDNLKFLLDEDHLESDNTNNYPRPTPFYVFAHDKIDMGAFHPTRAQSNFLVQAYISNIDPFIRILHKPRFKLELSQFHRVTTPPMPQRDEFEALLFSVYTLAILSSPDEAVVAQFGEHKWVLGGRYRLATERALERIGFLSGHSMMGLQAFVLYLTLLFESGSPLQASALTGLGLRLAMRLGLHRDGSNFNLSPWRIESRRRLWHYLCLLDVRGLENHGAEPCPTSAFAVSGTKFPQVCFTPICLSY